FMSFKRRLEKEVPKQSIYLARYGDSAWNRKYGNYIERDYSNIICGKVWVSDHAQIDIACMTKDGDVVFPWVTAWRDYKSGKWLGWLLQSGNPNSDHIFQTFYYAADAYGLPEDVIIDNGKDYRCKDFAGGRRIIKIDTNKARTTSMLDELNVQVHFALPYNAQTKPIERDFLKIKELLSKHCIGYRGGNVVERPEKLAREIKEGKILQFEDLKKIFDNFVINVLNKKPSQGKNLQGLAPDELFNREAAEKITTSKDALKLFCMRTSKNYTISRNGIKDRELGITYWADWMISQTGLKVYLRRDIQDYTVAWAFKLENEEFVGKVKAVKAVAALHADAISKEEFKEAMSIKKRNLKVAKSYIKQTQNIPIEEQYENYKYAYNSMIKDSKYNPKVSKIANTKMDQAIQKAKEMEQVGKHDLGMFMDDSPKIVKDNDLYLFETDKILEDELKEVAYGY
ncbi:DDE-type integrase/transposase/recombinase, partial [bacterium]|nr:DDE-type integrase/transposase/recombinase [bacterium]